MEKIKKILSPKGRAKLKKFLPETPVYVLRAQLSQNQLTCSELIQAGGVKVESVPQLVDPVRTATWKGITNFVQPAEWFGYLCAPGVTYREVLTAFLGETLPDILRIPFRGAVVALLSLPPHSIFHGSRAAWQELVDITFADDQWLIPLVVEFMDFRPKQTDDTLLFIDRDWTTLISGKDKRSIAFGTHTDYDNFRCNKPSECRGFHWQSKGFKSRKEAWAVMLKQLGVQGKVICFGDRKRGAVAEKALQEAGLVTELVWKSSAELAVDIQLRQTGVNGRDEKPEPTRWSQTEVKTTAELFGI